MTTHKTAKPSYKRQQYWVDAPLQIQMVGYVLVLISASLGLTAAWWGVHDPALGATASQIVAAILPRLVDAGYRDELIATAYDFAQRYPYRGRSLADDRLDEFAASGALAPEPEPVPTPTSR